MFPETGLSAVVPRLMEEAVKVSSTTRDARTGTGGQWPGVTCITTATASLFFAIAEITRTGFPHDFS